jgi:hypothetical protein
MTLHHLGGDHRLCRAGGGQSPEGSLALLVQQAHMTVPVVSAHVFETLLIAYVVPLAGNLFRGI